MPVNNQGSICRPDQHDQCHGPALSESLHGLINTMDKCTEKAFRHHPGQRQLQALAASAETPTRVSGCSNTASLSPALSKGTAQV